jgi:hypothetical protein
MLDSKLRRRVRTDPAALSRGARSGPSSPTGPAGGALAGMYPDPSLAPGGIVDADVSDSAAIAGTKISSIFGNQAIANDAITVDNSSATITAATGPLALVGGPSNKIFVNSGGVNYYEASDSHEFIGGPMSGDGRYLTNLPSPATLQAGAAIALNSSGEYTLAVTGNPTAVVVCWAQSSFTGQLCSISLGAGEWLIQSSAGTADSGQIFNYIAF